jgi:hypothetical protein
LAPVVVIGQITICDQSIPIVVDGLVKTIAALIVSKSVSCIGPKSVSGISSEIVVLGVGSGKVKLTSTLPVYFFDVLDAATWALVVVIGEIAICCQSISIAPGFISIIAF